MIRTITLLRDGEAFEAGDLNEGDWLTYDVVTGEILTIADKDGNEQWKSDKVATGKVGRMVAARRPSKSG